MRFLPLAGAAILAVSGAGTALAQSYDEGVAPTRSGQDAEGAQFEGRKPFDPLPAPRLPPPEPEERLDKLDPYGRGSELRARIEQIDSALDGYQRGNVIIEMSNGQDTRYVVVPSYELPNYAAAWGGSPQSYLDNSDRLARQLPAQRARLVAEMRADRDTIDVFAGQLGAPARPSQPIRPPQVVTPSRPPQAPVSVAQRFGVPPEIAARSTGRREIRYDECWHAGGNPNSGCTMIQHSVWVYSLDNGGTYWDRAEYDAKRAQLAHSGYTFAWSREK